MLVVTVTRAAVLCKPLQQLHMLTTQVTCITSPQREIASGVGSSVIGSKLRTHLAKNSTCSGELSLVCVMQQQAQFPQQMLLGSLFGNGQSNGATEQLIASYVHAVLSRGGDSELVYRLCQRLFTWPPYHQPSVADSAWAGQRDAMHAMCSYAGVLPSRC